MIIIDKWAGLATNASPYAIPPGAAATQVNLQVLAPGQLTVRPGLFAVTFASSASATQAVRSAFRHSRASDIILYQDAAGRVLVGSGPS